MLNGDCPMCARNPAFDCALCACKRVPDDMMQAIVTVGKRLVVVDVLTGEVLSDGGDIVSGNQAFQLPTTF